MFAVDYGLAHTSYPDCGMYEKFATPEQVFDFMDTSNIYQHCDKVMCTPNEKSEQGQSRVEISEKMFLIFTLNFHHLFFFMLGYYFDVAPLLLLQWSAMGIMNPTNALKCTFSVV